MSKTKEQLVTDFATAVKDFHRVMGEREAHHKRCSDAEERLTQARLALFERMTDWPKAPQVGQPGGPFGPKLPGDNTPALDKLAD